MKKTKEKKFILRNILTSVAGFIYLVFVFSFPKAYKSIWDSAVGFLAFVLSVKTILDYFLGLSMSIGYSRNVINLPQFKIQRVILLFAALILLSVCVVIILKRLEIISFVI